MAGYYKELARLFPNQRGGLKAVLKEADRFGTSVQRSFLTPVENLLQVGRWAIYPGGTPVCVLGGALTARYVRQTLRKRGGSSL